jgi:hypothetical protein
MATDLQTEIRKNSLEDIYEFPYRKPEEVGCAESWKREIWNPETRQVLGRTGKSWGEFMYSKLANYCVKLFHVISCKLYRVNE